jgi:Xaa-Pro aminopeptidase
VTRTWPVNGKFTNQQREVYEVVLEVQSKLIELCGIFPTLDSLFDSMCVLLGKGLQEIGVIPKILTGQALVKVSVDSFDRMETGKFDTVWKLMLSFLCQNLQAAYQFCPHHVSHYLGMDVHDTPLITRNIKIRPGMIITVEPGNFCVFVWGRV